MPLYGNDLLAALEGHSDNVGMAYVRSLWHYWHQYHCAGLPDDDDYLRRICRQEMTCWARVKGVVFGQFFHLQNGKWHQKRCRELFAEANSLYQKRVGFAANARANISANDNPSDNTIGPIVYNQNQNQNQIHNQNQNQSQNQDLGTGVSSGTSSSTVRVPRAREDDAHIPTWDEVKTYADMHGVPSETAKRFFDHHTESDLWLNTHGRLIHWQQKLTRWVNEDRSRGTKPPARKEKSLLEKELERACK